MQPTSRLTAATVALGLVVAACGSDAEALTKPEYIQQANSICQTANDELEPLFDEFWTELEARAIDPEVEPPPDDTFEAWSALMQELTAVWSDSLDELRSLAKPEGDQQRLQQLYDDFEAALNEAVQIADAAVDGGHAARQAMEDADPFTDVNIRARVYGLTVCGEES